MRAALAVVVFGAFLGLYAWRTGGALHDGDEAIYAEMAREMARGSGLGVPKWQDHPVLNRPPAAVWVLAAAVRSFGDGDRVVRAVPSVEMALAAALLFVFAALRYDNRVALVTALLFGASDLVVMYARYIESEPLLLVFVLAACVCWQKRWMIGFGVCLALSLMTKQIVGALPLLLPALDRDARGLGRSLLVAAALALPWHLYAWIRFGHAFPAAFLWQNLVVRSSQAMHDRTTASFYLTMLWRREGALLVLAVLGLVFAAVRRDYLPAAWTLAVLVPFSLAASRYDYYALLAIPALALGSARIACDAVPRLRGVLAAAVVIVAFVQVVPRVRVVDVGPYEVRTLAQLAKQLSRPGDAVLVFDQLPYSARYYADRYTLEVSTDRAQYDEGVALAAVLPTEIIYAPAPAQAAARFPRWFAIAHKSQLERLAGFQQVSHPVARTQNFFLFTNVLGPG